MISSSTIDGGGAKNEGGGDHDNGGCGGGGTHLRKGPWTAAEDAILMDYVQKHGEGNWNAVQRHSGLNRCGKSCRLRWANHLRPNLKKGAFSAEEERLIVELHAKCGNKWARMAALLPGRTDNEIKNYWNTRVKRHQRQGIPLYPPELLPHNPPSPCPQPLHHHHYSSSPTTPTSSFTFQTQLPSPTTLTYPTHHQHTPTSSTTPPNLSPLPSPTTTTTSPAFHTLPLFDLSIPRTPPILQTPPRFKRFSTTNNNNSNSAFFSATVNPSTHFSLPLSPLTPASASSTSPLAHQIPCCFPGLVSSSSFSNEFHRELQKENHKMYSLFASMTQPELPSSQLLSPTSPNWNSGIGIATTTSTASMFGRRVNKRKLGNPSEDDGNGGLGLVETGGGLLDDILQEGKALAVGGPSSTEPNCLVLQEQKPKPLVFEGFGGHWDHPSSLILSSDLKPNVDAVGQLNTMPEDSATLLNTFPSSLQTEFFSNSGDISNGPSSVVTDDNMDFDLQQIASLFPTTSDQSRTLGSCSWGNLPRIC